MNIATMGRSDLIAAIESAIEQHKELERGYQVSLDTIEKNGEELRKLRAERDSYHVALTSTQERCVKLDADLRNVNADLRNAKANIRDMTAGMNQAELVRDTENRLTVDQCARVVRSVMGEFLSAPDATNPNGCTVFDAYGNRCTLGSGHTLERNEAGLLVVPHVFGMWADENSGAASPGVDRCACGKSKGGNCPECNRNGTPFSKATLRGPREPNVDDVDTICRFLHDATRRTLSFLVENRAANLAGGLPVFGPASERIAGLVESLREAVTLQDGKKERYTAKDTRDLSPVQIQDLRRLLSEVRYTLDDGLRPSVTDGRLLYAGLADALDQISRQKNAARPAACTHPYEMRVEPKGADGMVTVGWCRACGSLDTGIWEHPG